MHRDSDASRSIAGWLSKNQSGTSKNWWFLFPRYGLAVQVVHGIRISWDGRRIAPHCSAALDEAIGNALFPLYCAFPTRLGNNASLAQAKQCEAVSTARSSMPGAALYSMQA